MPSEDKQLSGDVNMVNLRSCNCFEVQPAIGQACISETENTPFGQETGVHNSFIGRHFQGKKLRISRGRCRQLIHLHMVEHLSFADDQIKLHLLVLNKTEQSVRLKSLRPMSATSLKIRSEVHPKSGSKLMKTEGLQRRSAVQNHAECYAEKRLILLKLSRFIS